MAIKCNFCKKPNKISKFYLKLNDYRCLKCLAKKARLIYKKNKVKRAPIDKKLLNIYREESKRSKESMAHLMVRDIETLLELVGEAARK